MKYYLYISDAKVDMLFPQVPHEIKSKVASEYKFDIKLFSASRKTETEGEDNRIARLESVVDFIQQYGKLGTVDHPDDFIADTLSMRWGPAGSDPKSELVLFEGHTPQTVAVLGGSMHHVLGHRGESFATSSSTTPALLHYLTQNLADENVDPGKSQLETDTVRFAILATRNAQNPHAPMQNVEFLAKRLLHWLGEDMANPPNPRFVDSRKFNALLATPLYVAMTD